MHAMLETENGLVLMASDTPTGMEHTPASGISIALSGDDDAALRSSWDALSSSGNVSLPVGAGAVGRQLRDVHRPVRGVVDGEHRG